MYSLGSGIECRELLVRHIRSLALRGYARYPLSARIFIRLKQKTKNCPGARSESGAGDGIRTRDPNLGKVVLYQLSYTRIAPSVHLCPCFRRAGSYIIYNPGQKIKEADRLAPNKADRMLFPGGNQAISTLPKVGHFYLALTTGSKLFDFGQKRRL